MLDLSLHSASFNISMYGVCAKDNSHLPTVRYRNKWHHKSATSFEYHWTSSRIRWRKANLLSQCAAVRTKLGEMRNPPQLCVPLICTDAMYPREPAGTFFPWMISPLDRAEIIQQHVCRKLTHVNKYADKLTSEIYHP